MPKESLLSSMPKLILAVVLIVCVGAVMGLMGYALTKKQTRVEAPEIKTLDRIIENDISNWQTYRNKWLKYEFKYPDDLLKPQEIKSNQNQSFIFYPKKTGDYRLTISYITKKELSSLGTMTCWKYPDNPSCESIQAFNTKAAINWTKFVGTEIPVAHAWIKHSDGGVVTLIFHSIDNENKPIFRQILSTFKFIEKS